MSRRFSKTAFLKYFVFKNVDINKISSCST